MDQLKVLILEDVTSDAELIKLKMMDMDYELSFAVTNKKEDYIRLLKEFKPDLIIADFSLPAFTGLEALEIYLKGSKLVPFIFLTGTLRIDSAVAAIKSGATDFIIKQHIDQLPGAVTKALREMKERKGKLEFRQLSDYRAKEILRIQNSAEALINSTHDLIFSLDFDFKLTFANQAFRERTKQLTGKEATIGERLLQGEVDREREQRWQQYFLRAFAGERFTVTEEKVRHDDEKRYLSVSFNPIFEAESCSGAACFIRDVTDRITHLKIIEEKNERLHDIAWTQSHVLRAPLTRLKWLINMLGMRAFDELSQKEVVEHISTSANELDDIIKDIVEKTERVANR